MAGEKQHSDGRPAGQVFGQSASDLVGFYGATPVVQGSVSSAAITALVTTPTATDIAIAVNSLITRVEALRTKVYATRLIGQD